MVIGWGGGEGERKRVEDAGDSGALTPNCHKHHPPSTSTHNKTHTPNSALFAAESLNLWLNFFGDLYGAVLVLAVACFGISQWRTVRARGAGWRCCLARCSAACAACALVMRVPCCLACSSPARATTAHPLSKHANTHTKNTPNNPPPPPQLGSSNVGLAFSQSIQMLVRGAVNCCCRASVWARGLLCGCLPPPPTPQQPQHQPSTLS